MLSNSSACPATSSRPNTHIEDGQIVGLAGQARQSPPAQDHHKEGLVMHAATRDADLQAMDWAPR